MFLSTQSSVDNQTSSPQVPLQNLFGMELDAEKTLAKYSSHKVVNDINNVVLEQSHLNEKTTKEKLVLGFENNVGQQSAKMSNFEDKSTNVKVESLKKWTMGLSLMFLLIIAGLVTGLLILTSEIQDLNLQNTNTQDNLKSKDQMLTSEIQDLKLQNTNIQNDLKSKDQMLTSEIQDLKLQTTNIQNDLKSMSGEGGEIAKQIDFTLVKKGVIDCENSTQCDDDKACMDSMKERGKMLCEPVCERLLSKVITIQWSFLFNIHLSDSDAQSDIQSVLAKITLHLVNVKKDFMETVP